MKLTQFEILTEFRLRGPRICTNEKTHEHFCDNDCVILPIMTTDCTKGIKMNKITKFEEQKLNRNNFWINPHFALWIYHANKKRDRTTSWQILLVQSAKCIICSNQRRMIGKDGLQQKRHIQLQACPIRAKSGSFDTLGKHYMRICFQTIWHMQIFTIHSALSIGSRCS